MTHTHTTPPHMTPHYAAHKPAAVDERPPRRLKRFGSLAIVLAAGAAVIAVALAPVSKTTPLPPATPPLNVSVQTVQALPTLVETFDLPGVAEPHAVVKVAAEVAGRIEKIAVQEGKLVSRGQPMIYLNTDLLQAEHDRATAQAAFDQRELDRIAELAKRGVATATELDSQRTRLAVSRAALEEAKARLARTVIFAAVDGILEKLPVEAGEYIQAGAVACTIVDVDTVKIAVDVPEQDIRYVKVGELQQVIADADRPAMAAKVSFMSELAHPLTHTTRVELSVDNRAAGDQPRPLRSGQIVTVRLARRSLTDVILVPLAAVLPLENGREVYVVQEGLDGAVAASRKVELGLIRGSQVQVVKGLQPQDKLIVANHRFITEGQKIRIVESH